MISNMLRFSPSFLQGLDEVLSPEAYAVSRQSRPVFPAVNMGVTDDSVEVYLFAPGLSAEDLDVTLEKNLLSVAGERSSGRAKNPDEADMMQRNERPTGRFKRTMALPEDVDPDQTEAVYANGVLHIRIAKKATVEPRQIKVEV